MEDGQPVTHYFTDADAADAAVAKWRLQRALSAIGAWSDLDWDEMETDLDRIRHESKPTGLCQSRIGTPMSANASSGAAA